MKIIYSGILIFLLAIGTLQAQDSSAVDYEVHVSKMLMGTIVETTARYPDIAHCKEALYYAYQEMQRVEDLLSYQKKGSEIAKVNASAGVEPVRVSGETFSILQRAMHYAKILDGLFDVTIGPITSLWGFSSPQGGHVPQKDEITSRLPLINWQDLVLNPNDSTVYLRKHGMLIDLGGIAKGYAIDRGSAILKKQGITNFILNAGGDIYVSGEKEKNTPWKIGVKNPRDNQKIVASFDLKDYAVATSGDYERFIIVDGKRYHHIIDPRNGYPARLSESSTAFAATAEQADVMATYLFIIGAQQALQKETTTPFLIIDSTGKEIANNMFKNLPGLEF